jgi:hypothetical protein
LAVSAPFGPASELATLTEVARRQPNAQAFSSAINAKGAYRDRIRQRMRTVTNIVKAAAPLTGYPSQSVQSADHLTWQLLRALFVIELQFEGDAPTGRTNLVSKHPVKRADFLD